MDTINIGTEWVRVDDICDILRIVSESVTENASEVVEQIARLMYRDKLSTAQTEEEKKIACDLQGSFVVVKDLGYRNPNGKRYIYFVEFADGEGKAVDSLEKAMVFKYKGMADHVAKRLGHEWISVCIGVEYQRITGMDTESFLDCLFND